MIVWLNDIAASWYQYFLVASVQNTVYIGGILLIIYLFSDRDIRFLRMLTILGLIKLIIPPFIKTDSVGQFGFVTARLPSIDVVSAKLFLVGDSGVSFQSWILIGWMFIVLVSITVMVKNSVLLRIKYRQAKKIDSVEVSINQLKNRVKFFITDQNHSPFLVGFFRYKVFLPEVWNEWSADCRAAVITHELTHIKQKDPWLNLGRMIVLILNFYNPLVWLLSRKVTRYSEMVCDDYTTRALSTNNILYSKHLIQISEKAITGRPVMNASLAFSESYKIMKDRITHQLNRKEEYLMKNLNSRYKIGSVFTALIMFLFSWQLIGSNIAEEKIYAYGEIDQNPELVEKVMPKYPKLARKNGIQGTVEIQAIVDENGDVIEATILKSMHADLKSSEANSADDNLTEDEIKKICTQVDYACIDAAKATKFKPGEHKGEKVKVRFSIPYTFKLK